MARMSGEKKTWTPVDLRDLPATIPVATADAILGIGASLSHRLRSEGKYPVRILPSMGRNHRVSSVDLLTYLGIGVEAAPLPAALGAVAGAPVVAVQEVVDVGALNDLHAVEPVSDRPTLIARPAALPVPLTARNPPPSATVRALPQRATRVNAAKGSVRQRHNAKCALVTDSPAVYADHKCRGSWSWHLDLGRDTISGKRLQKTGSGFRTQRDAQVSLDEAKTRVAVTGGRSEGVTVGQWLEAWLTGMPNLAESTRVRYQGIISLHLVPLLGHVLLHELNAEHVDWLLATLTDRSYAPLGRTSPRYINQKGLSSASVNRIYDALNGAFTVAAKRRMITWNPVAVVDPPREVNKSGKAWTPQEAAQFLDFIAEHRLYAAFHVVLLGGVRRAEIAGAKWDLVDLERGTWDVTNTRVQVGGRVVEKEPKSAAGIRLLHLDANTVKVLRDHQARQVAEQVAAGDRWVEAPYVFRTVVGRQLSPDVFSTTWRALNDASGLPVIRLHDGRHTSVTVASEYAKVSDQVILERHGHSQLSMSRKYRHVNEALHRQAAEDIAKEIEQHRAGPQVAPGSDNCQ